MISFGPKKPLVAEIKRVGALLEDLLRRLDWVRALPEDDFDDGLHGLSVSVNEIQCKEAGCPPVETVCTLLRAGAKPRMAKVLKAVRDVTAADVEGLVAAHFSTAEAVEGEGCCG